MCFFIDFNQTEPKLENIMDSLNSTLTKELLDEIEALKDKTEMNRVQGKEAKDAADASLNSAEDANKVSQTHKDTFNVNMHIQFSVLAGSWGAEGTVWEIKIKRQESER